MASSLTASTTTNSQREQAFKNFLAYDETVTIIPTFRYKDPMDFILSQKSIGPFHAGEDAKVPLWCAIYLRKRNLCRLKPPSWMSIENLKKVLKHERDPKINIFSRDLPFRYMEIARGLLQACGVGRSQVHAAGVDTEEFQQAEQIRLLLEDIHTVRMDKIRQSIHNLSSQNLVLDTPMAILDVTGIGSIEMAAVKPFLEATFADHFKMVQTANDVSDSNRNYVQNNEGDRTTNSEQNTTTQISGVNRSRIRRFR